MSGIVIICRDLVKIDSGNACWAANHLIRQMLVYRNTLGSVICCDAPPVSVCADLCGVMLGSVMEWSKVTCNHVYFSSCFSSNDPLG